MTIDLQAQADPVPAGAQVCREEALAAGIERHRQQMGFHCGDRGQVDRVDRGVVIAVDIRRRIAERDVGGRNGIAAGVAMGYASRAMVPAFAWAAADGQSRPRHHFTSERRPGLSREAQQDHDRCNELPDAHERLIYSPCYLDITGA